jgi:RNA polymerase sigma factor (TIGR02999 family)
MAKHKAMRRGKRRFAEPAAGRAVLLSMKNPRASSWRKGVRRARLRAAGAVVDVDRQKHWNSRGHFFAAAAEAMRRILVDKALRKRRVKRGGGLVRQDLNEDDMAAPEIKHDLLALDKALDQLAEEDRPKYELVKLRFFAGLTIEQAPEALGIFHLNC